jgi:hypothetical protein
VADRTGFAPPRRGELTRWTGPDAGPPAFAVAADPRRDKAAGLSVAAASALAVRLLGPAATTATWKPTSPTTATGLVDGCRYLVVNETDPYGCFESLSLYQLLACHTCANQHPVPISPAGKPGRELAGTPTRSGIPGRVPATNPSTRTKVSPCAAGG